MSASDHLVVVSTRIGDKALHQHLLVGDPWVWIDAGIASTPGEALLPHLEAVGLRPPARHLAVVTHADVDHFGGLAELRAAFPGLVTLAHHADAGWIEDRDRIMTERYAPHRAQGLGPSPARAAQLRQRGGPPVGIDVRLSGGEHLGPDGEWVVLHLPGHSPGHIGLWQERRGRAVIGDAVLGWGVQTTSGDLMAAPHYTDLHAYLATIELLRSLRPTTLHTSHFDPLHGRDVGEFLGESRAAATAIGGAVHRALADGGGATLAALCDRVARVLDRWPADATSSLADPIAAHLTDAVARGDVVATRRDDALAFDPAPQGVGRG